MIGNNLEIIVDGYNFLMTTGMMGTQVADIELEQGRRRLLDFLAQVFPNAKDRKKFTIVFDSRTKLSLPTTLVVNDLQVRFSKGYSSADELIMELIRANHVPKRLLVVSSDHEIQTCAQRRKANFVDSDRWLDLIESIPSKSDKLDPETKDPEAQNLKDTQSDDSAYWLSVFTQELADDFIDNHEPKNDTTTSSGNSEQSRDPAPNAKSDQDSENQIDRRSERELQGSSDFDGIFPPGYAEDLLEDD
ncbi:MAG: NYN domain-containing protein [Planctomycetota bacterium]|nr:NYN domain-containing protein [Planctomycetota bacterium]